jgi:hypothetical protein
MAACWFGRSSTRADDIRPGRRYRRRLGRRLAVTATVLELRSDLVGIPHVRFSIAVDGSETRLSEGDTRVLALQSFLDAFCEPVATDPHPDPRALASANVIQLLPRRA